MFGTDLCACCAGCSWIKTVDPRGMPAFIVAVQKYTFTYNTFVYGVTVRVVQKIKHIVLATFASAVNVPERDQI